MYINAEKTTLLHVEPTTKCNASCPGCPRNNNGFGIKKDLLTSVFWLLVGISFMVLMGILWNVIKGS